MIVVVVGIVGVVFVFCGVKVFWSIGCGVFDIVCGMLMVCGGCLMGGCVGVVGGVVG